VLASHGVDQGQGLADAEVELKRAEFGTNELDKDEGTPLWKLVLQQFDDLLVKILLGAAVLSFVRAAPPRLPPLPLLSAALQERLP
jgi:Ca2+-transporting ATPase